MPPFDLDSAPSPTNELAPLPRVIAATREQFAAYDRRARELGYRDPMRWMIAVLDAAAIPPANDDDDDDDDESAPALDRASSQPANNDNSEPAPLDV